MLGPLCLEKHMCPGTMSTVCPQSQVRFGKKHFSARDRLARVACREEGAATRRHSRIERTRFADRLIFGFQPPQPGGRASPADENEPCRHSRRCHESAGCRLQKPAAAPSDFGPAKRDLRELSSAASECVWRQQSRVAPRLEIGRTWCAEYRQHTSHEETAKDPVARG
jgi:hypothetical protein